MAKTIPGVPESFTREQYLGIFEAVGLAPDNVLSLTFDVHGVHAVVFERDADGARLLTNDGYAKHLIHIPVKD